MKAEEHISIRIHLAGIGMLFLMAAAFFIFLQQARPATISPRTAEPELGTTAFCFSQPGTPLSRTLRGGPDAVLAEAIETARDSVDMAVYRLDLWSIRDALIGADRRGVRVRVVVEGDHASAPEVEAIRRAGIEVVAEERDSLMHHKFVVIDLLSFGRVR